ncbi:hypothetical protein HD554DRAFT_1619704 [Boletus coccyginus]|nr:hypothetical protein HD554DRAFT_1619704 [Boletus coccyginus]
MLLTMRSLPSTLIQHLPVALLTTTLVQLSRLARPPYLRPIFVTSLHCGARSLMVLVDEQELLRKVNLYRDGTGQPHADNNNMLALTY